MKTTSEKIAFPPRNRGLAGGELMILGRTEFPARGLASRTFTTTRYLTGLEKHLKGPGPAPETKENHPWARMALFMHTTGSHSSKKNKETHR